MTARSSAPTALLVGAGVPLAEAIARRLRDAGLPLVEVSGLSEAAVSQALAAVDRLGALVIVTAPPALGTSMLEVDDAQLEASLEQFLDLFGALHQALPRLEDGASVLAVSSRGHLGAWGGAHEMAFAGAIAGLLRSVALENMARGVRANLIAVELPDTGVGSDPAEVADLAHYLLSPAAAAVNGELILANGGRSLQMREARDRRPAPAAAT
ncbi:SDR family oxidoreductase [Phenylobacterium sp.]|uniref:SDR family oxidoreductase n=1 Tax=Phenylobacterium sp. TaxID=1871053 RepID=UPI0026007182|nr:SDR family oxidoreductase [Phenylobacterium sp.]